MTISLAFLAPDLVKAAIEGRLPAWHWRCAPLRTAPPNGPASTQQLGLPRRNATFEPSLRPASLRRQETEFSEARDARPEIAAERLHPVSAETETRVKKPAQIAGYSSASGNLGSGRRSAWWAREDSNLQPDRYERSALTIELRARRVPSINGHRRCATPASPARLTVALGCDPVFAGAPWLCTSSA